MIKGLLEAKYRVYGTVISFYSLGFGPFVTVLLFDLPDRIFLR